MVIQVLSGSGSGWRGSMPIPPSACRRASCSTEMSALPVEPEPLMTLFVSHVRGLPSTSMPLPALSIRVLPETTAHAEISTWMPLEPEPRTVLFTTAKLTPEMLHPTCRGAARVDHLQALDDEVLHLAQLEAARGGGGVEELLVGAVDEDVAEGGVVGRARRDALQAAVHGGDVLHQGAVGAREEQRDGGQRVEHHVLHHGTSLR